jgi:hypothetical protein
MLGWPPWRSRTPWSSRRCRGAPTAVMTTNLHPLHHGLGEVPVGRDRTTVTQARRRAARTWPAIVGFAAGAALGAACFATAGLTLLVLPIGLALLALPSARGQQPTDANQQAARLNVSRPGRQWPPPRRRQRPGEANHRPSTTLCLLAIRTRRSAVQHATTKRHPSLRTQLTIDLSPCHTDEASPLGLRSTRNYPRRATHLGCSIALALRGCASHPVLDGCWVFRRNHRRRSVTVCFGLRPAACPVATRMGVSVRPSRRCHSSERKTGLDATGLDARNHGVSGAEPPIGPELPERVEQVRAALSDADRVRFEQDLE